VIDLLLLSSSTTNTPGHIHVHTSNRHIDRTPICTQFSLSLSRSLDHLLSTSEPNQYILHCFHVVPLCISIVFDHGLEAGYNNSYSFPDHLDLNTKRSLGRCSASLNSTRLRGSGTFNFYLRPPSTQIPSRIILKFEQNACLHLVKSQRLR
jgi:hypothetical protein